MIALIANQKKYDCLNLLKKIRDLLKQQDTPYEVITNYPFTQKESQKIYQAEGWIILGGDGTILSSFSHFARRQKGYVLAVNFGTVGYMAGINEKKALSVIRNFLQWMRWTSPEHGKSKKPSRKLFKEEKIYTLFTEGVFAGTRRTYHSLNETVLRIVNEFHPITIDVRINGTYLFKVRGDGIIVATSTGSTAYNLSAGGPILSSEIEAFVLTFISPHSLSLKPIVIARGDTVELIPHDPVSLAIDGVIREQLLPKESIRCYLSAEPLTFVQSIPNTAYHRLKYKLHWGRL